MKAAATCKGTLTITDAGVSFEETYKNGKKPKHPHAWRWDYQDIQQLKIAPKSLTVLTYKDNKWKLGADREYEFDLVGDKTFEDAYQLLRAVWTNAWWRRFPTISRIFCGRSR